MPRHNNAQLLIRIKVLEDALREVTRERDELRAKVHVLGGLLDEAYAHDPDPDE